MAAWAATVSIAGGINRRDAYARSGARALVASSVFTWLAVAGVWTALYTRDFSLRFAASHSSWNLPTVGVIAALWAGAPGSLLVWAVACVSLAALSVGVARGGAERSWMSATLGTLVCALLAIVCVLANPYERLDFVPPDGRGLIPSLQLLATAIDVPLLLVAFASTAVPYAHAMAALMMRRIDAHQLDSLRRWSLVSWGLLSAALLAGIWRGYVQQTSDTPGSWRLIELAVLFPWLTSSAQLHASSMRVPASSHRRMVLLLATLTGLLSLFGAFVFRRGLLAETQAYYQYPVGTALLVLLVVATVVGGYLIGAHGGELDSASVGQTSVSATTYRARRSLGGTLAHVGAAVLLLAGIATSARREIRGALKTGETMAATDRFGRQWVFTSQGMSSYEELNRQVVSLTVSASRDGKPVGLLSSEQRQYIDNDREPTYDPITVVGIHTSPLQDVMLTFDGAPESDVAALHVAFTPVTWWMWIGGALMILGGMASAMRSSVGEKDQVEAIAAPITEPVADPIADPIA